MSKGIKAGKKVMPRFNQSSKAILVLVIYKNKLLFSKKDSPRLSEQTRKWLSKMHVNIPVGFNKFIARKIF